MPFEEQPGENSTIRDMRQHIKELEKSLGEERKTVQDLQTNQDKTKYEERIQALEAELETAKKEVETLKPAAESAEELRSTVEELYKKELESVPEEQRGKVESLSSTGSPAERLKRLREVKELIGAGQAPVGSGTITQPSQVGPGVTTQQIDPKDVKGMGWGSVLKK